MSKSKYNFRWSDEGEYEEDSRKKKNEDRRNQKRLKNALRSKNFAVEAFVNRDE
jgi:hypothetical protein